MNNLLKNRCIDIIRETWHDNNGVMINLLDADETDIHNDVLPPTNLQWIIGQGGDIILTYDEPKEPPIQEQDFPGLHIWTRLPEIKDE